VFVNAAAATVHGVTLTAKDRRRAVERLLRDEDWREWSDRQIAWHWG
jgi:hypothetical protein